MYGLEGKVCMGCVGGVGGKEGLERGRREGLGSAEVCGWLIGKVGVGEECSFWASFFFKFPPMASVGFHGGT